MQANPSSNNHDEVFSTPPSTPLPSETESTEANNDGLRPSLSRNSRPSSIHTDHSKVDWTSDIILEGPSPNQTKLANGVSDGITTPKSPVQSPSPTPVVSKSKHMQSPCFVHSHLDKGASLAEWLRSKQPSSPPPLIDVAPMLRGDTLDHRNQHENPKSESLSHQASVLASNDDDDDFNGSLTKQLADTAIGVREMSKQLGQS
jgi:NAD+ kinase